MTIRCFKQYSTLNRVNSIRISKHNTSYERGLKAKSDKIPAACAKLYRYCVFGNLPGDKQELSLVLILNIQQFLILSGLVWFLCLKKHLIA